MKTRKIAMVALVILLFISITACGQKDSNALPTDILKAVEAKYTEMPDGLYYYSGAEEYGDGYLDPSLVGVMYGDGVDAPEFALLESYSIRIARGKSGFELGIFKVKESTDVAAVQKMCEKRIEILRKSDIVLYDAASEVILKNAEVYTVGNYVYILSTTDNALAKEAIKAAM